MANYFLLTEKKYIRQFSSIKLQNTMLRRKPCTLYTTVYQEITSCVLFSLFGNTLFGNTAFTTKFHVRKHGIVRFKKKMEDYLTEKREQPEMHVHCSNFKINHKQNPTTNYPEIIFFLLDIRSKQLFFI